ncbi:MAG: phosphatidate cytidylyltransferase [Armatimonadetes bacterium]|nr:phosphatidate cytidylyltransferase [Armatimonadota bacterium]
MPRRLANGLLYVSSWVALAWFGGWLLTLGVACLALLAAVELRWVASRRRLRLAVEAVYPVCLAFVFAAARFAGDLEGYGLAVVALLVLLVLVDFALHLNTGAGRSPTAAVSLTVFTCVYCGLMLSTLVLLRGYQPDPTAQTAPGPDWPFGKRLMFFLLAVTMAADAAAYVVARMMEGKPRAEGAASAGGHEALLAAAVAGVGVALLAGSVFNVGVSPSAAVSAEQAARASLVHRVVLGAMLGLFGQLGRQGAAIFKHEAEVSEYSRLFPGRGGVLDRCDSLIVTAPLLYLYVHLAL